MPKSTKTVEELLSEVQSSSCEPFRWDMQESRESVEKLALIIRAIIVNFPHIGKLPVEGP